jgi:hypothetical protein
MRPEAWRLFRMLQDAQNLKKVGRLNTISQISTQNLGRHGFSNLPQTNKWKQRSCFEDHIFGVGFEIEGLN